MKSRTVMVTLELNTDLPLKGLKREVKAAVQDIVVGCEGTCDVKQIEVQVAQPSK